MSDEKQLPTLWEQHHAVLQRAAMASAVVFAASTVSGGLAWGAVASQLVAMITMVGARREHEEVGRRVEVIEKEVARLAGVDADIKATLDWLEYQQVLGMERTEEVEARLKELEDRVSRVDVTARDARHTALAYAQALAADDEESARAYARAAARAIAGRTRNQIDAAALALADRLTSKGLAKVRTVYGRHWPDGKEPYHQGSATHLGWSCEDLMVHAALGTVTHSVPAHRHTLEPSYTVRLTPACARLLDLMKKPEE